MPAGGGEGDAGVLEKGWADAGRTLTCFTKWLKSVMFDDVCVLEKDRMEAKLLLSGTGRGVPVLLRRSEDKS